MLDVARCERARLAREPSADGKFYVAVKTTGIYCRPVCRSRAALARNVEYFATPDEAAARGYRACKRCRPAPAR